MEDLIRREDAIDVLCDKCSIGAFEYGVCRYMFNGECAEVNGIKDIPTVEPKRGEWIPIGIKMSVFECSECGTIKRLKSNFCPRCGAEMREREGE